MRRPTLLPLPRFAPRATLASAGALLLTGAAIVTAPGSYAGPVQAAPAKAKPVKVKAVTPPDKTTSNGKAVDLGVLFVGAHPDDESGTLSTFGQWRDQGIKTGVVTITRGEGGGNAVGPEEGPALGLLREAEERAAVGKAGITDVFNLDKVDFYYTVSEPLTRQVWGHEDTLGRLVRVIRSTRPEVLMTMNPAPSPGQHGNHQEAARLTAEAYRLAGDPSAYPEQITKEHLKPFSPSRLVFRAAWGTGASGPQCAGAYVPTDPTQHVYGAWGGVTAKADGNVGKTWAQIEREAQRLYASQGWAGFPDAATDPAQIGCDYMTLAASRTPFPAAGSATAATNTGVLDGALVRTKADLPLGTGLEMTTSAYSVAAGQPVKATVTVTAPKRGLVSGVLSLTAPQGWTISQSSARLGGVRPGRQISTTATLTPPADAVAGTTVAVKATLTDGKQSGYTDAPLTIVPRVEIRQADLPQVAQFRSWAEQVGLRQFANIVLPVRTVPSGGSTTVNYVVTNHGSAPVQAQVQPTPPAGFTATPVTSSSTTVAAGASVTVPVAIRNVDTSLKTGMYGGVAGDYLYSPAVRTSDGATSTGKAALELVPSTTIPKATTAPVVDGKAAPGEYTGPTLDISRLWEGTACTSAADCSGTAQVSWSQDTLYLLVHVADDTKGTALDQGDCKRHWRTDSLEIAIDPRGTSENTSTTFKTAILPFTAQGGACFLRDADNHQGDASTAPGMKVAVNTTSNASGAYTGYTAEVAIPMADLPGAIDPQHMGLNIFAYDSDTQDKTGQTRIGWSTWGGVQGDPYRWGVATLPGYVAPAGRPTTAPAPVMPLDALASVDSPQSIEQAVRDNVALAGGAASAKKLSGWATAATPTSAGPAAGRSVTVQVQANAAGRAHVFVRDASGTAGSVVTAVRAGRSTVTVPLTRALAGSATVDLAWVDTTGGTLSSQVPVSAQGGTKPRT